MTKKRIAVLVMSYGTPESMDLIEEYYTHIRRGNPPTQAQLDELTGRYETIVGGFFPLRRNTDHQVSSLQDMLQKLYPDVEYECFQGLKHAAPYIEDGVSSIVNAGYTEAIGIVLAPHYSIMSVGSYVKRAQLKAVELGLNIRFIESYFDHPLLIEMHAERVRESLDAFTPDEQKQVRVLFSAHSLPEKILEMNDPYQDQLHATSKLIAEKVGIKDWQFAWQSAGQTAVPWLGPDILDVLQTIHNEEQVQHVIVCPIGFVSDHLEVLYDIDIECQQIAKQLDMKLVRTRMLNSDPKYMQLMAEIIHHLAIEG